ESIRPIIIMTNQPKGLSRLHFHSVLNQTLFLQLPNRFHQIQVSGYKSFSFGFGFFKLAKNVVKVVNNHSINPPLLLEFEQNKKPIVLGIEKRYVEKP